MPTHVALLRGVNVGGGGKLPMAELRQLLTSLGHADVTTYIQSGNVVFTPSHSDAVALASELRAAIAARFGLDTPVIVMTRAELSDVISANPYTGENPRYVHAVFLPGELDEAARSQIKQAEEQVRGQGSSDEVALIGRTLYLHTPDGFGTSELAKTLLAKRASPAAGGTARNWNTVTKLLTLCDS
ncbi:MAG TPA: DUF1697 domain-containing protein [Streptosporangiaceae bacterium]|nr:DUF1697 domain-containing protein [Streptosporangiaceae bacterium]